MKKFLSLALALVMIFSALTVLASCNSDSSRKTPAEKIAAGEELNIGIIQYLSHPSLDNCYNGIMKALNDSGIKFKVDRQIGSNNSAENDCSNFAKKMVADRCDIIFAIATPAAKSAYAATFETDIPVIFCAVSDPVSAKLVKSNEKPGDLCTGTSDILDLEAQVNMIQTLQPDVKKIGVIYTSSEENSITNLNRLKQICSGRNIEVVASAVQNASDIPAACESVCSQVDCVNNFVDNNLVQNLSILLSAAEKHSIPVYGSEVEQVKKGCIAAVSIDYVALGKATGEMGIEVLKGADITNMAVKNITDAEPVINTDILAKLGIKLPDAYKNAQTVVSAE